MQFSARTRIAKNKHAVNREIILFTQHPQYLCGETGNTTVIGTQLYYIRLNSVTNMAVMMSEFLSGNEKRV